MHKETNTRFELKKFERTSKKTEENFNWKKIILFDGKSVRFDYDFFPEKQKPNKQFYVTQSREEKHSFIKAIKRKLTRPQNRFKAKQKKSRFSFIERESELVLFDEHSLSSKPIVNRIAKLQNQCGRVLVYCVS